MASVKIKKEYKGKVVHTVKNMGKDKGGNVPVSIVLDEKASQTDLQWLLDVKKYPGVYAE